MSTVDRLAKAPEAPSVYPSGVAPEFHVLGSTILQTAIDDARDLMCADNLGSKTYSQAVLYYAAHLLTLRYPGVAAGSASEGTGSGVKPGRRSQRTGDNAVTFDATPGSSDSVGSLASTRYGRMYLHLIKGSKGRMPKFFGAI